MYQEDNYNPVDPNEYDSDLKNKDSVSEELKSMDRGYNVIYRKVKGKDGKIKDKRIEIYTTSGFGNHIRDAETGEYYSNFVGTNDEYLFYKVGLSTGECRSANGSNTLFYLSPQHYATHLHCSVSPEHVQDWETRRRHRVEEINSTKV